MKIANTYKRLQYSPFDLAIIMAGVLCIISGVYYFNKPLEEGGNFRNTEKFGSIKEGNGSRKLGSSLQWFNVGQRTDLFYGDVIFANEDRDITIALAEDKDANLVVPKDSMIKISKTNGEFNLDVSKGSVLINSKKQRKINIRDKRGKVRKLTVSRGLKVKISSKKSNVTVEAIQGKARIQARANKKNPKPKTLEVQKGKLLMVGPKESKVVNKIKIVSQKRVDPLFTSKIQLTDKFKNLRSVELSNKENFKKIKRVLVKDGKVDISSLNTGEFFIREGKEKDYDSFVVKNTRNIDVKVKKPSEMYEGDKVQLFWSGRPELMYRVEVEHKEDDSVPKFSKLVQGNTLSVPLSKSGDYKINVTEQKFEKTAATQIQINLKKGLQGVEFEQKDAFENNVQKITFKNPRNKTFRLKVMNQDGKLAVNKLTKGKGLSFKRLRPGIYDLKITSPDETKKLFEKQFKILDKVKNNRTRKVVVTEEDEAEIRLKWTRRGTYPDDLDYKVRIFKDGPKKELVKETTTDDLSYEFETEDFGKYIWEIVPEENEIVQKSEQFNFELKRPSINNLTVPKIILKYIEDKDCYQFTLPKNKYAKTYDTHIYSSRVKRNGFWRLMYRKKLEINKDCIKSKGEGKYYYKFRILDKWGRVSDFSKLGEIYFPISPLDDF